MIETFQEDDGRFGAVLERLPGVMAYGGTRADAVRQVKALALEVVADRLKHHEWVPPEFTAIFRHPPTLPREIACMVGPGRTSYARGGKRKVARRAAVRKARRRSRRRR
jgi:predicted RNase H-like HicB family nuclease